MLELQLRIHDVGTEEVFLRMRELFPSLSPEALAQKAKELGKEPLCRENLAEHLFVRGMRDFEDKELNANPDVVASSIYKAETANILTELTQKIMNAHIIHEAKLKGIERKHGQDSEEYKKQSLFLAGVDYVFAVFDCHVTGKNEIQKALEAAMGEVPAGPPRPDTQATTTKVKKKPARRKKK